MRYHYVIVLQYINYGRIAVSWNYRYLGHLLRIVSCHVIMYRFISYCGLSCNFPSLIITLLATLLTVITQPAFTERQFLLILSSCVKFVGFLSTWWIKSSIDSFFGLYQLLKEIDTWLFCCQMLHCVYQPAANCVRLLLGALVGF